MRVYLPATFGLLATWAGDGVLPAGPACAVTPALRESYASGDTEELEWVATSRAARESLQLLAADPVTPRRRVVVAADAPDELVHPAATGSRSGPGWVAEALVHVGSGLQWRHVAAVLADDAQAEDCVSAAVVALSAAATEDPQALEAVEDTEGYPLSWYAVQEVAALLDSVGLAHEE